MSSVELEKATHVTITRGLSRQFSLSSKRRSSVINDTILEEELDDSLDSQSYRREGKMLDVILEHIPAKNQRRLIESGNEEFRQESVMLEKERVQDADQHQIDILGKYSQLTHEAEVEIRRSKDLYPDTSRSREVMTG